MCAPSLCVLFALGRRFKGKKCNDVICHPETLLQVQSGDNNKLGKYTQIPEQNTYSNGIRPPCQILVAEYPFICLCFSVTLLKTHTHTRTHSLHCLIFHFPFLWSLTCVQVITWWVSRELRLHYTPTAWADATLKLAWWSKITSSYSYFIHQVDGPPSVAVITAYLVGELPLSSSERQ